MDAQSEFYDEIADRLVVLYNKMRGLRSDLALHDKQRATLEGELAHLEAKASHYEALFASDTEQGIPA